MRLARRQAQRVQFGFQMADDAIGAHQLNGADGILRDGAHAFRVGSSVRRSSAFFRGGLAGDGLSGQRGGNLVAGKRIFLIAQPGRAAAKLGGGEAVFAKPREIGAPGVIHAGRVGEILGIQGFQEGGIGAGEEGGGVQDVVGRAVDSL